MAIKSLISTTINSKSKFSMYPAFEAEAELDIFTQGTFTRASVASHQVNATDIRLVGSNIRRIENRGDGLGDLLLLETAATNFLSQSEAFDNAIWLKSAGLASATGSTVVSPSGSANGDILQLNTGLAEILQGIQQPTNNLSGTFSVFLSASSAQTVRLKGYNKAAGTSVSADKSFSSTWVRLSHSFSMASGSAAVPVSGSIVNGTAGLLETFNAWGAQLETNGFASSYVPTVAGQATRAIDSLTFPVGQYPDSFRSRGFIFTFVPSYDSAQAFFINQSQRLVFFRFGGSGNNLDWVASGGGVIFTFNSSSLFVQSGIVTFSAGQVLTITIRPNAGSFTIAGATTGNGTFSMAPFTMVQQTLTVGPEANTIFAGRYGRLFRGI